MENDRIKNHIKISAAIVVTGYLIASYIFGSLIHTNVSSDDRLMATILTVVATIVANYIYHENYTESK